MRRRTFRKYRLISKYLLIAGFVLTGLWNLGAVFFGLPALGWWSIALPIPGVLAWGGATAAPYLAAAGLPRLAEFLRLSRAPAGPREDDLRQGRPSVRR